MAEWVKQGLQWLAEVAIRESTSFAIPTNFYLSLSTKSSGTETDTCTSFTDLPDTGFSPIAVASSTAGFPTSSSASTNNWLLTTKQTTFRSGSTGWKPARTAFLKTVSGTTGILLGWSKLSSTRNLNSTSDKLNVDFTLNFKG